MPLVAASGFLLTVAPAFAPNSFWKHEQMYYATFKVREFESLFYKINTFLQKTITGIRLRAKRIFLVNIKYTYFSILFLAFAAPFLCYFQRLLVVKKNWSNFCYIVLLHLSAQKEYLRFLKLYFKLEMLIFLSFVVSFTGKISQNPWMGKIWVFPSIFQELGKIFT